MCIINNATHWRKFSIKWIASIAAVLLLSLTAFASPTDQVVINEVLYDPIGEDTGCFVELMGPPGLNLDDYWLVGVNGEDAKEYNLIDLSGKNIPSDGYFVVAQDESVPDADLIDGNANFQNGPDSIELWNWDGKVDSVGYGDFTLAVFSGEGEPTLDLTGYSIGRRPDGKDTNDNSIDFIGLAVPSPGEPNDPRIDVSIRRKLVSAWGGIKAANSASAK
jgi:hypothetical protein